MLAHCLLACVPVRPFNIAPAHVRTRSATHTLHTCVHAHTSRLLLPMPARAIPACPCLPADQVKPPVCYGHVLCRSPTVLACLCWSLLYAHVCTHVCTGNARTHTDALMVTRTHAMHARSCLTRTQAHAHAPVTRPGAKPGTCLSKYNPFQTLDKLSSRRRERRV